MLPLSSSVRRRKSACSLVFVAPRFGPALRGANFRAAARLPSRREMPDCCFTAVLRHHRFRAAWSAGMGIVGSQAPTNFAGCQFGPCSIRRERQPNNSLKRTVQSLRDWSCRLARSLGALALTWSAARSLSASARHQAARLPARPRRSAARRTQEPASSSRDQVRAGAGTKQKRCHPALPESPCSGTFRLTIRSSGQSNRFAIGAAA
jgi:hypothetical protein